MSATTRGRKNGTPETEQETDLEPRDVRALTEHMSIMDNIGLVRGADDMYLVVSESGGEYIVDLQEGTCSGPDFRHRDEVDRCKHIRACEFATGEEAIPAWVDRDAINCSLGEHVAADPVFADDAVTTTHAHEREQEPADAAAAGASETGRALADGGVEAADAPADADADAATESECDHPDCERGMGLERPELCFPCWEERQERLAAENAPR